MKKMIFFIACLAFSGILNQNANSDCKVKGWDDNDALMFVTSYDCTCAGFGNECFFFDEEGDNPG